MMNQKLERGRGVAWNPSHCRPGRVNPVQSGLPYHLKYVTSREGSAKDINVLKKSRTVE